MWGDIRLFLGFLPGVILMLLWVISGYLTGITLLDAVFTRPGYRPPFSQTVGIAVSVYFVAGGVGFFVRRAIRLGRKIGAGSQHHKVD